MPGTMSAEVSASATVISTPPLCTTSPGSACSFSTRPPKGDGSSTTDLADSTSTTGWSIVDQVARAHEPGHDLGLGQTLAEVR